MNQHFKAWLATATICAGFTVTADSHAALETTLGGQAYYDTGLNVTWLANANLAASNSFGVSGIDASGWMTWNTAMNWIGAMNAANYLGYNDWRLPTTGPVNGVAITLPGAPSYETYDGSADIGYSISAAGTVYAGSKASEMAYLFYNTLGNKAYVDFSGGVQLANWALNGVGPFTNLDALNTYWSSTPYSSNAAWNFDFDFGAQNEGYKTAHYYAWAVRTGDSPLPVPEPGMSGLLLSGLLTLAWKARQRRNG
jgi:hypothetical protein